MVRLLDACDGIRVGSLPMSRSSLPFMLLWAVLLLAPVQALADELHGRGSAAFATTEDPQNPTTRYLVAFTDHANGDVKVGRQLVWHERIRLYYCAAHDGWHGQCG